MNSMVHNNSLSTHKLPFQQLAQVPFTQVFIEDKFWSARMKALQKTTLKACLTQCEQTGRISNFAKAAGLMDGEFEGIFYNDSDVYKVLEGIAYSLMNEPDAELEAEADKVIDFIAAAQEDDGYLQTYFTLAEPDKKWTDMNKHEEYCAGHLIEAAIAYYQATGKRKLLDAAIKLADHIDALFGLNKRHWVSGHQEIELALVKLYLETKEERYWKLAYWFLEERGYGHGVGYSWDRADWGAAYSQDHLPVREMSTVTGHAVRAVYMYAGMTDVAALTGDEGYLGALDRLWDNVVNKNMYITGGIGPSKDNEGFTSDYDLPNQSAYCETCASVAMILWNHRMNLLHGDSKYADIVEREMYNGALAGVSLSGDKFFYVNPLETDGSHHRVEWYNCSCCPTQIARFIPSIGNYVYAVNERQIVINQYIAGIGSLQVGNEGVTLKQETNFPWDGTVTIQVEESGETPYDLLLRIPSWCKNFTLKVDGEAQTHPSMHNGYVKLSRAWKAGMEIELVLEMPVQKVYAHPLVIENTGKVALQRGPIVYCIEEMDNAAAYEQTIVSPYTRFQAVFEPNLLEGVVTLYAVGGSPTDTFQAIPYYAWDNRDSGKMRVWLPETKVEAALYEIQ
jgi:DUF1680 family protein